MTVARDKTIVKGRLANSAVQSAPLERRLGSYSEYRDSGVEWLGEIPSHWNVRRLGQIGPVAKCSGGPKSDEALGWSYFVGQSEGKVKVDSDWV